MSGSNERARFRKNTILAVLVAAVVTSLASEAAAQCTGAPTHCISVAVVNGALIVKDNGNLGSVVSVYPKGSPSPSVDHIVFMFQGPDKDNWDLFAVFAPCLNSTWPSKIFPFQSGVFQLVSKNQTPDQTVTLDVMDSGDDTCTYSLVALDETKGKGSMISLDPTIIVGNGHQNNPCKIFKLIGVVLGASLVLSLIGFSIKLKNLKNLKNRAS
ncbi:MAG TPA: hypothetical protein VL523_10365 [Terriglobia bacterium]|nr:hypothetical protein [Terriglobia bacterium]